MQPGHPAFAVGSYLVGISADANAGEEIAPIRSLHVRLSFSILFHNELGEA